MPSDAAPPDSPRVGTPHRISEPTALERWIERGPQPIQPLDVQVAWHVPVLVIAGAVVLLFAIPGLQRAATVVTLALILGLRHYVEVLARARSERAIAALRRDIANLPFPVGDVRDWLAVRYRMLGPLVIRLDGTHALAADALRAAEPSAQIDQPAPDLLIVTARWSNTLADLQRVRRVLFEALPLLHAETRVRGVEFLDHPPALRPHRRA